MKRVALALVGAVVALTSACGSSSNGRSDLGEPPTQAESTSPSPAPTTRVEPAYAELLAEELESALLSVQDLSVGYSQEPPDEPTSKTFCDYEPPFDEEVYVSRDFIKGAGVSSEVLSVGLRQYGSADQARASFDALIGALGTCQAEIFNGVQLEYAVMSAPQVGDDSVGVRISADGTVLLQNFVLVGPTIVATGGGGVVGADAEEIAGLAEAQVEAYQVAASN